MVVEHFFSRVRSLDAVVATKKIVEFPSRSLELGLGAIEVCATLCMTET